MVDIATMRKFSKEHGMNFPTCASASQLLSRLQNNSTPSSGEADSPTPLAQPIGMPIPMSLTPALDGQYDLMNFVGMCGHWRHYSALSIGGAKDASVLLFTKKENIKAPARIGRINRLGLLDLLRYGANQLHAITHPRLLRLMVPLSENKDLIAMASEPIFGTLDTFLEVNQLEKLEAKLGVLQLIEGLSYLHNSAKILHGNLNPACIYVAANQQWKIGGFEFSVSAKKPNAFPCYSWTKKLPPSLQPNLDFLAPEYLAPGTTLVTTSADVFSLGVLICFIYAGGKKLIDCHNNLDSYAIVIEQLDAALDVMGKELSSNLKDQLLKVVSKDVEQRPAVQLIALIKHFDDPALAALRTLDETNQMFDPGQKTHFLSHTLLAALPSIPEKLWFSRILNRFNDSFLTDSTEIFHAILRPLTYMVSHCESHNIAHLRPWFRRIVEEGAHEMDRTLVQAIFDNMNVIFRRLSDEYVEDRCFEIVLTLLTGEDIQLKQSALRVVPAVSEYIPLWFINKKLIPALHSIGKFFDDHVPRQIDLLVAISHLSDRCDVATLNHLLSVVSLCNKVHPAIVHSKSRLVQRILTCDITRLRNPSAMTEHLLSPLIAGLSLNELSPSHFDDVMSSVRILLDVIEQIRYDDDTRTKTENGGGRLCSRRVSMSSNHLPRLLITAARPSFGGDGRKMSFLSADGRLEERRESKDSRASIESDVSIRIGNGSDVSDESATGVGGLSTIGNTITPGSHQVRRKSWLEGYMHSVSLEQSSQLDVGARTFSNRRQRQPERRSRTRSPTDHLDSQSRPARPNSFTNLGHNLACTLWKTFY
ncbi:Protein kinase domain-containing protein [Aphelenchoides besseyi]|nr:Protein kinase domain-containing protein [Aphelenchoides besseyi]